MNAEVVVIGAGFGGLFVAAELRRRGVEVLVVDEGQRPGGVAATETVNGYMLEPAAGTFLVPHPHLSPILKASRVETEPAAPSAATRYVYTRGRLVGLRPSPAIVFSPVLGWGSKLRTTMEPFARSGGGDDETVASFLHRRFGREAGALLAAVMAKGVYAGDPARLAISSTFPLLARLEQEAGSVIRGGLRRLRTRPKGVPRPTSHVPVGGMAAAAKQIVGVLGDAYRPMFPVTGVRRDQRGEWRVQGPETVIARQVVLAVDPATAQVLLGDDDRISFPSAPVAVVWLGASRDDLPIPDGFGYLAGPDTDLVGLGCLFESSYAPGRAPAGQALVKVVAGGALHPEVVALDDSALVDRIVAELERVLGREIRPGFLRVVRHLPGIPQYEVGHGARLAALESGRPDGIHFAGWGYRGVGIGHLATDATRIADAIDGGGR